MKLWLTSLILLLAAVYPASAQTMQAFAPGGPTVSLAVTATTARVQFQTSIGGDNVRIFNSGTVPVFIACGDVSITATQAASLPIAPGTVEVIGCPQTYIAGIAASAATLYVTPGNGL